jgi:peptidoglycan/LPS O-acetylase OafA/YrhL
LAFDPSVLPQHVLLIQAWGTTPTDQWNFPSWSISAEWFAYLCFPAAAIFSGWIFRRPLVGLLAAAALFAVLFAAFAMSGLLFTDMTSHGGALRIVPSFLAGAAIYNLGSRISLPKGAVWVVVVLAVGWIAAATTLRASDLLIWPALGLLIFALGETSKHPGPNIVAGAWLVYLGEASFALYMMHLPVDIIYFHGFERYAPSLVASTPGAVWGGVFFACIAAAVLIHEAVEQPARRWMRRHDPFARRPPPEPPHEPVL